MTSEIESKLYHHLLQSFALQRKIARIIRDDNVLKESQTAEMVEVTDHDLNMPKNSSFEESNFYCKYGKNDQNCPFWFIQSVWLRYFIIQVLINELKSRKVYFTFLAMKKSKIYSAVTKTVKTLTSKNTSFHSLLKNNLNKSALYTEQAFTHFIFHLYLTHQTV